MLDRLFYPGPSLVELHSDYAKNHTVDRAAQLVSASSVEIDAPIVTVWETLADILAWPHWASRVDVLDVQDVRPDASFTMKLNGVRIDATFAVVDPPKELSWTGRFWAYRAIDRNCLAVVDANRTHVVLEESLAGPLLPLFYTSSQLKANHERWLHALKTFVESERRTLIEG